MGGREFGEEELTMEAVASKIGEDESLWDEKMIKGGLRA